MKLDIDPQTRINLRELIAEIQAAVPDVDQVEVVRIPQTQEKDGRVESYGYQLKLVGKLSGDQIISINQVIESHNPTETSEQEREADRVAKRIAEFEDIIEEAVRRARQPGGR